MDYDAEIVGKIEAVNQYQIQFKGAKEYKELEKIEKELCKNKWIEQTSINFAMEINTDSYYPNDSRWKNKWSEMPDDGNWGLEAIDAPDAWEYREQMQTVNIGVIDVMFDTKHEDLIFAEEPLANYMAEKNQGWHDHGTHVAGTIGASFNNKRGITGIVPKQNLYGVSIWGMSDNIYTTVMQYKISLSYLIVQKKCQVINISLGSDLLEFQVSRGSKEHKKRLQLMADDIGGFLEKLVCQNYDFVICVASGNKNEEGKANYTYFKKDEEDSEYQELYYNYQDYLNYLAGEPVDPDLERLLARYRDRQQEIEGDSGHPGRLESGNVKAECGLFASIQNEEVKNRIIIVGAAENKVIEKQAGIFNLINKREHEGYEMTAFTQGGDRLDIIAPGVGIESTVHKHSRQCGHETGQKRENKNENIGYKNNLGTSMASPHVAGVAALVYSVAPNLKGDEVKKIICDTAQGEYNKGNGSKETCGLVNARAAVEQAVKADSKTQDSHTTSVKIDGSQTSEERDIVLVLDTSGSMSGKPLDETKKAASNFVQTILKEDASIGIISYNSSAEIESGFSKNERVLLNVIDEINSGGGTNIEAGIQQAEIMLEESTAKKKIIVLMSDGEPNEGKEGDELIACTNEIKKDKSYIYTLGFFSEVSDKVQAQYLMEQIASDGCHYEVENADDLVYFFEDMADQINGQKYIYVRIACPVDVSVTNGEESLNSRNGDTRTSFGTLSFEEKVSDDVEDTYEEYDNRTKILRLKEGSEYEVNIVGNGAGSMDYTIGLMDEDSGYSDFRRFENIQISKGTIVNTIAVRSDDTILKVDEDGDGRYDLSYHAGENEQGELIEHFGVIYALLIIGYTGSLLLGIIVYKKSRKLKKNMQAQKYYCSNRGQTRSRNEKFCPNCGKKIGNESRFCKYCGKIQEIGKKNCLSISFDAENRRRTVRNLLSGMTIMDFCIIILYLVLEVRWIQLFFPNIRSTWLAIAFMAWDMRLLFMLLYIVPFLIITLLSILGVLCVKIEEYYSSIGFVSAMFGFGMKAGSVIFDKYSISTLKKAACQIFAVYGSVAFAAVLLSIVISVLTYMRRRQKIKRSV